MFAGFVGILRASNNEAEAVLRAKDALSSVVCRPCSVTRHRLHIPFPIECRSRDWGARSILVPPSWPLSGG
jgi:hypothetical protein